MWVGNKMKKDIFEDLIVVKRSGQRVSFNSYKIAVAIKQAFDSVYNDYDEKDVNKVYEDVLKNIESNYFDRKTINVEDIQDIIENTLKKDKYHIVYDSFSEYRKKRAASRKVFTIKQQHKFIKAMEKIAEDNSLRSENDYKTCEIINNYGKTVLNEFTKSYIIDNKFLRAHEEGNIFIHDMELFPLGVLPSIHIDLKNNLDKNGLLIDLLTDLLKVKNEINGEKNIPSFDYLLEEYTVNKYKVFFKENIINYLKVTGFYDYINIKKIIELIDKEICLKLDIDKYKQFINTDIVTNIFNQAYLDSIDKVKKILKEDINSIINVLDKEKGYSISLGTNNNYAGDLINQEFIKCLKLKLNNLNIIYKIKNKDNKYLNDIYEILKINNKINLAFVDTTYNKDINEVEYFHSGIRIFDNINFDYRLSSGRMVVAKTSLNINRLALKHKSNNIKDFYKEMEEDLELIKNNLLLSFETIGNKNKDNYEVLFNNNVFDDEKLEKSQKIRKVIKNGILLIGIVGLKDCVQHLTKDETKQYKLITEILMFLNKKCAEFAEETKLNFEIYEPFEREARKELSALDKAIYGINKDKDIYDLISNLPSLKNDYKKLGYIQRLFSGGNVVEIKILPSISQKKFKELITDLIDNDVGFVKINR